MRPPNVGGLSKASLKGNRQMTYGIKFTADCEGDWTDDPTDGRDLRFASTAEAWAWWDAHYRGPDCYGNQAYPVIYIDDFSDATCE